MVRVNEEGKKYQQDIQHFGQIGRTSLAKHSGQSPLARQRANGRFQSWLIGSWFRNRHGWR
jgi:hypothetical protein